MEQVKLRQLSHDEFVTFCEKTMNESQNLATEFSGILARDPSNFLQPKEVLASRQQAEKLIRGILEYNTRLKACLQKNPLPRQQAEALLEDVLKYNTELTKCVKWLIGVPLRTTNLPQDKTLNPYRAPPTTTILPPANKADKKKKKKKKKR